MAYKHYEQERQAGCGCGGRRPGYQYDPMDEDAADLFFENERAEAFAPYTRESASEPYCDRDRVYSPISRRGGACDRRCGDEEDICIVIVNVLVNFTNGDSVVIQPANSQ